MTAPTRIQLRRSKGWEKPANAIVVARPSRWGNPFLIGGNLSDVFVHDGTRVLWRTPRDDGALARAHENATEAYRGWLAFSDDPRAKWIRAHLEELSGREVACWCPLELACHGDVLLELANREAA